jgi:hypothetical protein
MIKFALFCSALSLGSYFIPAVPDHEPPGPHHFLRNVQATKWVAAAGVIEPAAKPSETNVSVYANAFFTRSIARSAAKPVMSLCKEPPITLPAAGKMARKLKTRSELYKTLMLGSPPR